MILLLVSTNSFLGDFGLDNALPYKELLETAIGMHLLHDITTSEELTFDVDLWNGWPIGVVFNLIPNLLALEHVDILVLFNSIELEDLDYVVRETASWHLSVAFHEQAYVVLSNPFVDLLSEVSRIPSNFRLCSKI